MNSTFLASLNLSQEDQTKLKKEIERFEKASQANPEDHLPYVRLGTAFYYLDKPIQAEQVYRKALELSPDNGDIINGIGFALCDQSKYKEAMKENFAKVHQLNPTNSSKYFGIGYGLRFHTQPLFEQAAQMFEKETKENPLNGDAYIQLAMTYLERNMKAEAHGYYQISKEFNEDYEEIYNKRHLLEDSIMENNYIAYPHNPNFALEYFRAGIMFGVPGVLNKAIEVCEKALEINPKDIRACRFLAFAYLPKGLKEKSLEMRKKVLTLETPYYDDYYKLAFQTQQLGNQDESIMYYKKTVEVEPGFPDAWTNLGCLYHFQKKYPEAEEHYRKALEIDKTDGDTFFNLGVTYEAQGKFPEALNVYIKATLFKPDHVGAHLNAGFLFEKCGQHDKAIEYYQKVVELDPYHTDAYLNLGSTYKRLGEHALAIKNYIRAVTLSPHDAEIHNNLGTALRDIGETKAALSAFNTAIQLDPEHLLYYINRGGLLRQMGQKQQALSDLNKAHSLAQMNKIGSGITQEHFIHLGESLKADRESLLEEIAQLKIES